MSETKGYPHKQPFCVKPAFNKEKKNSWWIKHRKSTPTEEQKRK